MTDLGVLIRQLQGALGGNAIVRGTVSSTGGIVNGDGFSVVRNGAGDYTVTFDTPLRSAPSLSLTLGSTASLAGIKEKDGTTATVNGFSVYTFSTSALTNSAFHFVAIG